MTRTPARSVASLHLWFVGLGGRLLVLVLSTLNVVLVARALGPHGRGQYFILLSAIWVLSVLADLGLSQTAVVFSTQLRACPILALSLLSSSATIGVAAIVWTSVGTRLLPNVPHALMLLALAAVPASVSVNVWSNVLIGTRRLIALNVVQVAASAMSLTLNVIFVVAWAGHVTAAFLVYVVVCFLQGALMIAVGRRGVLLTEGLRADTRLAVQMLRFGLRSYAGAISIVVWSRATAFLLNVYHGPGPVGIFSVAQQVAEKTLMPAHALQDVVFQKLTTASPSAGTAVMNRYLRVTVCSLIPLGLLGVWLAPGVVDVLLGPQYVGSTVVLRLLLVGTAALNLSLLLGPYFLGQLHRPGWLSAVSWLSALLNIGLARLLIPGSAEIGAALALVSSQIVGTAILLVGYLRAARTPLSSVLWVRSEDVALARQGAMAVLRRTRA